MTDDEQEHNRQSLLGRIAGVDYGTVRVGLAVTNRDRTIASPLENYTRRSDKLDGDYFRQLVEEERIEQWVVGLPVHLSGEESEKSRESRQFGQWLEETTGVPVEYFDERFTTAQADEFLAAGKLTKKQRQARRDMLAAQIMLSAYLACGAESQPNPQGLED